MTIAVAFGSSVLVPAFREKPGYLWLAWAAAMLQGCTPVWYFQGIEKMARLAVITLVTRLTGVAAILLFVRNPSDAWKVLAIYAVTAFLGLMLCLILVARSIGLDVPHLSGCLQALRDGWQMFVFRSAASVFSTANAFVLGIFSPAMQVAFYGGAERVAGAPLTLLGPLAQALYPRMSHLMRNSYDEARALARSMFVGIMVPSCAACGIVIASAPWLVWVVLGRSYAPAVAVLRVLSLIIPAVALQNILGIQWMLPRGLDREFTRIVIAGTLIDIMLAFVLAPRYGASGMAIAVTAADIVVGLLMFLVCAGKKGGLFQMPFRLLSLPRLDHSPGLSQATLDWARRVFTYGQQLTCTRMIRGTRCP
jgi:PST family polysaccharide transporter